jgi:cytochrome c553
VADKKMVQIVSTTKARMLTYAVAMCAGQLFLSGQVEAQQNAKPANVIICEPCHGEDGTGHDEIPNIAGQHSIYLFNQFMAFKKGQRRHPEMRSLARELTDQELNELIIYYSKLPRR